MKGTGRNFSRLPFTTLEVDVNDYGGRIDLLGNL
jgi:hypothetical protein